MKRRVFVLVFFAMMAVFACAADDQKKMPIAGEMDQYLGNWTGKPNVTDPKLVEESPKEHLTVRPALSGRFLLLESATELNEKTTAERIGFLSYNRDTRTFLLYWFDSEGNSSKFIGRDKGTSFLFRAMDPDDGTTLEFISKGDTRFRIETTKTADRKPTIVFYAKDVAPSNGRGGGVRRGHRGGMGM